LIYTLLKILKLLFLLLAGCLPAVSVATNTETPYFASISHHIAAFTTNNEFLFQCIIAFLIVIIFSYAAKLLYERKFKKE
jgi:hypothetical protein